MTEKQKKEAKTRILKAAISLFAQKGYSGVGVREIAKVAEVNISMISYYYNGKVGILKEIINQFHDEYFNMIKSIIDKKMPPEEKVRIFVRKIVEYLRTNLDITMIVFNSLPLDIPEIAEIKAERVLKLIEEVKNGFFAEFNLDIDNPVLWSAVGPSLLSIILAHFRFRIVQKNVLNIEFNDDFYSDFSNIVSTLFLDGIKGLGAMNLTVKGNKNENNG